MLAHVPLRTLFHSVWSPFFTEMAEGYGGGQRLKLMDMNGIGESLFFLVQDRVNKAASHLKTQQRRASVRGGD